MAAPAARAHEEPSIEIHQLSEHMQATASVGDMLRRAELYRLCGDWAAAERDLQRVAARAPQTPDLPLAWTALDLDRGRTQSAQHRIRHVLEARPNYAPALLLAARIARARHDDADVARLLGRALPHIAAPSPDLYLERAAALCALVQPQAALRLLDDGLARLGAVTSLVSAAARIEARRGRLAGGLARLETLAPQYDRAEPFHAMRKELVDIALDETRAPAPRGTPGATEFSNAPEEGARPETPATLTAPVIAAQPAVAATLVPLGATWRFDTTGVALDSAWPTAAYTDAAWPMGPAPLGFGETYIATPVKQGPDASTRYPTIYFRNTFTSPVAGNTLTSMTLTINYDDGFVAYLNGTEIARRGIAAGTVSYGTFAVSHEAGVPELISVTASLPALLSGDNVLAIEVHQTNLTSSDLVLDAALSVDNVPQLTRGPYLQVATPTSIIVRWRTDPASGSVVRFGTASGMRTAAATDATVTTEHEVALAGLQPDTRYWYTPATLFDPLGTDTTSLTFVTPPLAGTPKPTRFWIIGDSGIPGANQNAVRNAYVATAGARPADLWLMLGDNAYTVGTDSEYQTGMFMPYKDILKTTALWTTRGNHDYLYAGTANDYYDLFTLPTAGEAGGINSGTEAYYSFDYGDIHVVCLDSEGSDRSPGGAMMTWLVNDLAATSRKWRIAFFHHPPYTKGSHNSDNELDSGARMTEMRTNALPVLEAAGVDLVLSGHSHSYERSVLLDEHYGVSSSIADTMKINGGDGRPSGNGAYEKPSAVMGPHEGAVYSVVGSSAQTSGGTLNHAAMKVSLNILGSMLLDIDGNRLEGQFIDNLGAVRDSFVILKGMTGPHTILATATAGGTITPSGTRVAPTNAVETFTIAPGALHGISDVIVDGVSRGALASWTFTNVQANHTIEARFTLAAPVVKSIRDVPFDQGGGFAVEFRRSSRENPATGQPVLSYEAYRATQPLLIGGMPRYPNRVQTAWELVATLPATADSVYAVTIPTLADSGSAAAIPRTAFYISARTASSPVFWDSAVDSGYSVDNLAPAIPLSFTRTMLAVGLELRWAGSLEPDVVGYRVYRDTLAGFTPSPATLLISTADTVLVDNTGAPLNAYALQAVDRNGNASGFGVIQPGLLDVADAHAPSLWLASATPNPMFGRTRITFGLPRDAHTRLTLFDASGRVVRRLIDAPQRAGAQGATWDGRDDAGALVPNAIYFYELRVEGRVLTGRLAKLS